MIFHWGNARTFRIYSFFDQHMYNLRIYFNQKFSQWQGSVRFMYHTARSFNSLLRAIIQCRREYVRNPKSLLLTICCSLHYSCLSEISFFSYTWFCHYIVFEDENLLCSVGITCLSESAKNLFFNPRITEWFELKVKLISGFVQSRCQDITEARSPMKMS